jgi:photosystem II stability/assembly factor-like uncharacterized protein
VGKSVWIGVAGCVPGNSYTVEVNNLASPGWQPVGTVQSALGTYQGVTVAPLASTSVLVSIGAFGEGWAFLAVEGSKKLIDVKPCLPNSYWLSGLSVSSRELVWAVCVEGDGAGTPKSLLSSSDGGREWHLVAVDPSASSSPPEALPNGGFINLAAVNRRDLWMATTSGLFASSDGGAQWSPIPGIATEHEADYFSFANPTHGWFLVPGHALWKTENGHVWELATGPVPL